MTRTLAIVLGITLCGVIAAVAYPAPTASEIAACTPDGLSICVC